MGWITEETILSEDLTIIQHMRLCPGGVGTGKKAQAAADKICEEYGFSACLDFPCGQIPAGDRLRGELVLELMREPQVLLFQEPTFRLTPLECLEMSKIWRQMAKKGQTVVVFTRSLEIAMLADRCSVMRKGNCKEPVDPLECGKQKLEEMMHGGPKPADPIKSDIAVGGVVLEVRDLTVEGDQGETVRRVSFEARFSEITVICGLEGSGLEDLAFALAGMKPMKEGRIRIKGTNITKTGIRERLRSGIAFTPGAALDYGLSRAHTLAGNMVIRPNHDSELQDGGILRFGQIKRKAETVLEKMNNGLINTLFADTDELEPVDRQQAALAREIGRNPDVLIALHPTQGMNALETRHIWNQLLGVRKARQAVLLLTNDLDEAMSMADRLLIMHQGAIVGEFDPHLTSAQEVGLYLSGGRRQDGEEQFDDE